MLTNTFKKLAHFENYLGVGREVSEKKNLKGESHKLSFDTFQYNIIESKREHLYI